MNRIHSLAISAVVLLPWPLFADINSPATLSNGATLNLDTGATGASGGDIEWNNNQITVQGNATGFGLPVSFLGQSAFQSITQQQLTTFKYSTAPISGVNVALNWIIAIHTNGGNYAKLIVTANSGASISFQFTTYIAGNSGGGPTPTITAVQNNYSFLLPGQPNYGIAPGTLFIVKGTNLATNATPLLQSSAAPGLQTSLNGASISVTVGGTTVSPGLYYTSATQLAAVLPSTTPVGTGTITVSLNGQPSAAAQMVVVQSALGLDVATDASVNYFYQTASAQPGQTIILWGSGVGADTANDDKTFPMMQDNLTNIPMTVYIGGIAVTPSYRGRSQYPGVDQVNVQIPANVPLGCSVSIVAVSGSISSNSITVPVAQGGGPCVDVTSSVSPNALQALAGKGTISFGTLAVAQQSVTGPGQNGTTYSANATFESYPGAAYLASLSANSLPSVGSCVILTGSAPTPTGLDAGAVSLSGGGTQLTLTPSSLKGTYTGSLTSIPAAATTYTFNNGAGGKDVGGFNATLNVPPQFVWSNQSSVTTVNRAQGQTVTWSGAGPNSWVYIQGQSIGNNVAVTFECLAPWSAGQFTVPSWILQAMPAGAGGLTVADQTFPQSFSATGIDVGFAYEQTLIGQSVTYQ